MNSQTQWDVALSFASEQRPYVRAVANRLRSAGVKVFYDEYLRSSIWGKDLFSHLDAVYRLQSRYCVIFVSRDYAAKLWTNHERQSAQALALSQNEEYILPARMDETELPGLRPTTAYIDARRCTPEELASLVMEKVGINPASTAVDPRIPTVDVLLPPLTADDENELRPKVDNMVESMAQAHPFSPEYSALIANISAMGNSDIDKTHTSPISESDWKIIERVSNSVGAIRLDLDRRAGDVRSRRTWRIQDQRISSWASSPPIPSLEEELVRFAVVVNVGRTEMWDGLRRLQKYAFIAQYLESRLDAASMQWIVLDAQLGNAKKAQAAERLQKKAAQVRSALEIASKSYLTMTSISDQMRELTRQAHNIDRLAGDPASESSALAAAPSRVLPLIDEVSNYLAAVQALRLDVADDQGDSGQGL